MDTDPTEFLTRAKRHEVALHLAYQKVFGEKPNIALGINDLTLSGWLRLTPLADDTWRIEVGTHWLPRAAALPCLAAVSGCRHIKPTFEDALIALFLYEAHLRAHFAIEEIASMFAVADRAFGPRKEKA